MKRRKAVKHHQQSDWNDALKIISPFLFPKPEQVTEFRERFLALPIIPVKRGVYRRSVKPGS